MGLFNKLFGDPNQKEINRLQDIVTKINMLEPEMEKASDEELKAKSAQLKNKATEENPDDILPEAFALVRETAKRTIGQRHFDAQLMGGIVLHEGKIAEMKTGEGKTLSATSPIYLNALTDKGVHVVTVNDYLARRDAQWMGPIYNFLGLSVAAIGHEASYLFDDREETKLKLCSRKEAYAADITYGTNNEFGFDYLRDNMENNIAALRQRSLDFAIVDEIDSILIDEARTPLIISAPAEESTAMYEQFARLVPQLKSDEDYAVDEKMRAVSLTEQGIGKMEKLLGVSSIYDSSKVLMVHHLEEALKAQVLFKKNRDYVVKDGEIIIVDEFTGRLMPGRRYSEGLHQAIEAKEKVEIKRESRTLATISFQNLFRMYKKLAGMTGTAATEAEEFYKIYKLEVVEIPTNKPMIRVDRQDRVYKTEEAKFKAVVEEVKNRYQEGQPVLIGTISIEKNEKLSKFLKKAGIPHQVLNAKHHEREAKIIAQAGKFRAVTVATNMAGRGIDIILGGKIGDKQQVASGKEVSDKDIKDWEKEHYKILELGGLYVIGTERHESRRIDNQLRGRSGRQGDPGISQFYVSMEDDIMRIFGGERMKGLMEKLGLPDDMPIEHSLISRSIEQAQKKVEGHNFDIRKHVVEYDDVMNKHREAIYRKRRKILELKSRGGENWLHQEILTLMDEEGIKKYQEKFDQHPKEVMLELERSVYLRMIDLLWIEHLTTMQHLRDSIGLRAYGQRDPLVEYKQEAYNLYQRLLREIENQVVEVLLKVEISRVEPSEYPSTLSNQEQNIKTNVTTVKKVGRNDPCPCGAKKEDGRPIKYKHCHGR